MVIDFVDVGADDDEEERGWQSMGRNNGLASTCVLLFSFALLLILFRKLVQIQ